MVTSGIPTDDWPYELGQIGVCKHCGERIEFTGTVDREPHWRHAVQITTRPHRGLFDYYVGCRL